MNLNPRKILQILSKAYKRISIKIWWLDVIYPFLLSAVLFAGLTYLIYNGQKHRRLASQMEEKFIGFSLKVASPRTIKKNEKIITVNFKEVDLKYLPHIIRKDFTDVSPDVYGSIIKKLVKIGVKYIIISWRQPYDPYDNSWQQLKKVLEEVDSSVKIIFSAPSPLTKNLPSFFHHNTTVVESDLCQTGTQLICMYGAHWDDWIIQVIANDFWLERNLKQTQHMISFNLPRLQPSFLLFLNDAQDFDNYSYSQILFMEDDNIDWSQKAVFIGNSLGPYKNDLSNSIDNNRAITSLTPKKSGVRVEGTPLHEFWAQVAQLFIDQDLISIVPYKWSFTIAILFAAFIIFMLNLFGPPVALGLFLTGAAHAPLVNALLIRFGQIYLPIFDTIYAGLWSFIIITFSKLSLESFRSWQLNLQQKHNQEAADSKSNFVSLISHNLNTPVAKMQGLFEILQQLTKDKNLKLRTIKALALTTQIQLSIRFVLVMTAIDDNRLGQEPLLGKVIIDEFLKTMKNPLRRLSIDNEVIFTPKFEDLAFTPFRIDKRALFSAISAFFILVASRLKIASTHKVIVEADEVETTDGLVKEFLKIYIISSATLFSSRELMKLNKPKELEKSTPAHESLLVDLAIRLTHMFVHSYKGKFFQETVQKKDAERFEIGFTLYPYSDKS